MGAGFSLLSSIGISTGATTGANATNADAVKGRLTFDEAAFNAALDKDSLSVQKLLGGVAGTDGFSQSFKKILDPLVTTNGILDQRIDSAGKEVTRIGRQGDAPRRAPHRQGGAAAQAVHRDGVGDAAQPAADDGPRRPARHELGENPRGPPPPPGRRRHP